MRGGPATGVVREESTAAGEVPYAPCLLRVCVLPLYLEGGGRRCCCLRQGESPRPPVSCQVGYNPYRGTLEIEWDDEAELVLADLSFEPGEPEEETQLKLKMIEIYNTKAAPILLTLPSVPRSLDSTPWKARRATSPEEVYPPTWAPRQQAAPGL